MKPEMNYHERKELIRLRKENAKLQETVNRYVAERMTSKVQYNPIDITFAHDVIVTKIDGLPGCPSGPFLISKGKVLRLNVSLPLLTKP